ncbi:MAG: YceI family protein [Cyclobacteriaceae bacterium]|nr:YceI family protein [Cyclobacteriaceae bacterium]
MRAAFGILILFLTSAFVAENDSPILIHRFIVQPTSKVIISGKTNVNSFQCSSLYSGNDTLVLREGGKEIKPIFQQGVVNLEAAAFDCGMQMMTSDFCKTIKAKEYPRISINFLTFERGPLYTKASDRFKGKLKISLAGITKTFDVDCTIVVKGDGLFHLKGDRKFVFSDFSLEAPTRMMGLVRVSENLDVSFNLVLKLDPNS